MSIVTVNLFIYVLEVCHVGAYFWKGKSNVSDKEFLKIISSVILAKYTVILNSESQIVYTNFFTPYGKI
jgi:predicted SprT family Zn-dependent metalloprotease